MGLCILLWSPGPAPRRSDPGRRGWGGGAGVARGGGAWRGVERTGTRGNPGAQGCLGRCAARAPLDLEGRWGASGSRKAPATGEAPRAPPAAGEGGRAARCRPLRNFLNGFGGRGGVSSAVKRRRWSRQVSRTRSARRAPHSGTPSQSAAPQPAASAEAAPARTGPDPARAPRRHPGPPRRPPPAPPSAPSRTGEAAPQVRPTLGAPGTARAGGPGSGRDPGTA